ncbi:hypothetical protein [Thalassotalea crassostreae]|uniref:hypothetical protein n=1 Tax=Thalassotalea crassostreae TaxID=1763536 RepID=UPI0008386B83|nr:hypothetical protein [Thalassotalea crassostreae]
MNRHTKVAMLVAPLLIIGGYVASDFYLANEAEQVRLIPLSVESSCDVINNDCVLISKDFKVNIYDKDGVTHINSTFPLDTATLFLVDSNDSASTYRLQMSDTPYYWFNPTPLRELAGKQGDTYKMRIVATIKGGQYISEFYTHTAK